MEGQKQLINRNFILLILYFIFLIYYFIFGNLFLKFKDIFINSIQFYDLNFSMVVLPAHLTRDKNGKFIGKQVSLVPLPNKLKEAMVGELLGDGHLRYNKKGKDSLPKPNTNAQLAMTLKPKEYVYHLWQNIYRDISTHTPPHPWPNPKTGKPVTQYHFATRALPSLSILHNE